VDRSTQATTGTLGKLTGCFLGRCGQPEPCLTRRTERIVAGDCLSRCYLSCEVEMPEERLSPLR